MKQIAAITILFLLNSSISYAASSEYMEREKRQEEMRQAFIAEGKHLAAKENAKDIAEDKGAPTYYLEHILLRMKDGSPLPKEFLPLANWAKKFEKTSYSALGIEDIGNAVRAELLSRGFITSTAQLSKKHGETLVIDLSAGRIHRITWQGNEGRMPNLQNIFPRQEEQILNLRKLEQGIDQLNRLHSKTCTMDLIPSKKMMETDVIIKPLPPSSPVYGALSYDNYGLPSTGRHNIGYRLNVEDLFHANDLLSFSYRTDNLQETGRAHENFSARLEIPYGRFTYHLNAAHTFEQQRANRFYLTHTHRTEWGGGARYLIARNQHSKYYATVDFTKKISHTYLTNPAIRQSNKFELNILRRNTGNLSLGLHRITYRAGSVLVCTLESMHGVPWGTEEVHTQEGATSRYHIFNMDCTYYQRLSEKTGLSYLGTFHMQYSPRSLLSSEQFSIGGIYTVRGFLPEHALTGDNGYYLRNELSLPLHAGLEGYLALDTGKCERNASNSTILAGAAVGLRKNTTKYNFDFMLAHPLHAPAFIPHKAHWHFAYTTNF